MKKINFLTLIITTLTVLLGCSEDSTNLIYDNLTLSKNEVTVPEKGNVVIEITKGSGEYTVNSNDGNIAVVTIENSTVTITGKKEGKVDVIVKDSKSNQSKIVKVTIEKLEPNKVNFSAVFEDGEAIPHIGIWYLTGTEEYVEMWKDANTDLGFGGPSNTDDNGVKEQRYLKPNYKANLSKKTGKDEIIITPKDAQYIYVIIEPRNGEDFVKLLVNDKEVEEINLKGYKSNRIKIDITENTKIQLVCKRDSNYDPSPIPVESKKVKMQFIAYYLDEEGKKVNPEGNDLNNRLKGEFEIGKTYLDNQEIMNFITYMFEDGKKTDKKRVLKGNFKVKDKIGYEYKTTEYTSLADFEKVILGSSKSNDLIILFEYNPNATYEDTVEVKTYNVAFADWNWDISFEVKDILETTKIGDIPGALENITKIEELANFSHWTYISDGKTYATSKVEKGKLKDKLVKDAVNALGSVSFTATEKE